MNNQQDIEPSPVLRSPVLPCPYLVTSLYDIEKVSEILSRTNSTERSYTNIAAEWKLHNDVYNIPFLFMVRSSTEHADLDFIRDPRDVVYYGTLFYEMMGWY